MMLLLPIMVKKLIEKFKEKTHVQLIPKPTI